MFQITRSLARQLRAVFRRSIQARSPRGQRFLLVFHGGTDALRIRSFSAEVAVEYLQPGSFAPEVLHLPLEALADCEGRQDTEVTLETTKAGTVLAHWQDAGVPQSKEYEAGTTDDQPAFPERPEQFTENEPRLLQALADVMRTAAREAVRYATDKVLIRGSAGELVATNGQQLLVQTGFRFPWPEHVLIPSIPAFGCSELTQDAPVAVGRTADHVSVQVGGWTFHLRIDAQGRYPDVEGVLASTRRNGSKWQVAPEDAAFLGRALTRLPGEDDDHQPVTVDLNGQVFLRARSAGSVRTTELVLAQSAYSGKPVRWCCDRRLLARALQLGFREVAVVDADTPVRCQDGRRTYLWMPLAKQTAIPPCDEAIRITSALAPATEPTSTKKRRPILKVFPPKTHPTAPTNGIANPEPKGNGLGALMEEAQALKDLLRDAYTRTSELLAALKKHKRQSRLVESTLASLRQLHDVAP